MKRAVAFARVGRPDDAEVSVQRQIEACHNLAQRMDIEIVKEVTVIGGAFSDKAYDVRDEVVAEITEGRADAIIVERLERWTRDACEFARLVKLDIDVLSACDEEGSISLLVLRAIKES